MPEIILQTVCNFTARFFVVPIFNSGQKYHKVMERIQVLIDKLVAQNKSNSTADQLLMTVQLLQNELLLLQKNAANTSTKKVSIIMPAAAPVAVMHEAEPPKMEEVFVPQPEVKETVQQQAPPPPPVLPEPKKEPAATAYQPYFLRKPVVEEKGEEEQQKQTPAPVHHPFDAMTETPTLLQQRQPKEIHEAIGERTESLNDKLKQDKTELAHQLKETPVKDLRKAIGINDKFLFVNELFRGDEGMYERSIKTINNFHILAEAEYWMNRELKVKLGWNDSKDTVQHFYTLVRRRFS